MDTLIAGVNQRIDALTASVNDRIGAVNQRIDRLDQHISGLSMHISETFDTVNHDTDVRLRSCERQLQKLGHKPA